MLNKAVSLTDNRSPVSLLGILQMTMDLNSKKNSQTKQMLQSRDFMLMENKLDVENLDCTQESFDFFYWFSFERRVL